MNQKLSKQLSLTIAYGAMFASLRMLVGATSAVYVLSQGVSFSELGYLKSFQFILLLFLDIPLSYVADNYSRKFAILMASLMASLWLLVTAFATNFHTFLLAEVFNAISLSLFNGAFLSYLIDCKSHDAPDMDTKDLVAKAYKYEHFLMAVSSFIGASFITTSSNMTWLIAGVLMCLLPLGFVYILPNDKHGKIDNESEHALKLLTRDMRKIISEIKNNEVLKHSTILLVLVSVYFQIIIQSWQPVVMMNSDNNLGVVYGSIMCLIFFIQSLSAHFVGKLALKLVTKLSLTALAVVPLLLMLNGFAHAGLNLSITVVAFLALFFSVNAMMIIASSQFHDNLIPELRSTFDSLSSVMARFILIATFPLIMWGLQRVGVVMLSVFLVGIGVIIWQLTRTFKI